MEKLSEASRGLDAGVGRAVDHLLPLVYDELRRLASAQLADERPGQTLDTSALVHEAYLRLLRSENSGFMNQHYFFAAAATAMRRILVENVRRKKRLKHGGGRKRMEFNDQFPYPFDEQVVALDEGLQDLVDEDPVAAKVVELRYFAGLGHEQVAETMGITVYLARQKWTYARAWLKNALLR